MHAAAKTLPSQTSLIRLAELALAAGVGGMSISFLFLASNHPLDVLSGAAGFVAGSLLVSAGLISIALLRPTDVAGDSIAASDNAHAFEPPLDVARWMSHFVANQRNRSEPDWAAPITLSAAAVGPLVRSLEQFQLGDGGGPAYLIARDRERFLSDGDGTRKLVDLWFAEEREHARLLGAALARFGGQQIQGHWSFSTFCLVRKWLGVRFELTVLLLTEIVSTVYYRMLLRHGSDSALRSLCRLILRDEIGHVAFHRDRLARKARSGRAVFGTLWNGCFRLLGMAAATMLWINHAAGLKAIGVTRREYYGGVRRELSVFVARLRKEARSTR